MYEEFYENIKETIHERHSVRNYSDKNIPEDVIKKIEEFIKDISNPFYENLKVSLIKNGSEENDIKLGTYGFINGGKYFLSIACEKGKNNFIGLGYVFERIILYCTYLGLGTVWLGGSFTKGKFAKVMNLKENEILPIVSPLGYEGGKKTIIGKLIGSNHKKRKDFDKLFFDGSFNNPFNFDNNDKYSRIFEMVRLAPSAVNKQPWRILKINNEVHFFNSEKGTMHEIDMGIALCHFHLMCKSENIDGEFKYLDNINYDKYNYVISWISKN